MEIVKKYFWYVVAIGVLLLCVNTCTNSAANKLEGENNILEKQYHRKLEDLNKIKRESDKTVDSIETDNKKKNEALLISKRENKSLVEKISVLNISRQKELKQIKNFSYQESAEYIAKTYKAPQSVSFNDKGITVIDSLPNLIVRDIADNYYLSQELNLTKGVVFNLEKQTELLVGVIKNKDLEIKSVVEVSNSKDTAISTSQDLIGGQKKEIKKLKTARWIERSLIGIGIIGGLILIN